MDWDAGRLSGPDGEDWRVPVSELEARQARLSDRLSKAGHESVLIDDPVELYWLTGGRQSSMLLVGAESSSIETVHWVRRSLERAKFEAGEGDAPHQIAAQPRMSVFEDSLRQAGCTRAPGMLAAKVPNSRWGFLSGKFAGLGGQSPDCTEILFALREIKSDWEIEMLAESGRINRMMFEAIHDTGGIGKTEIEMAAAADEVSRAAGFGGRIRMRTWPMDCDRVVIAAGSSGAVPSYFDSGVAGLGASPIASLGAGFAKVVEGEPVLVDIVHVHRGYVSDCTRIFSAGSLSSEWHERLDDMAQIGDLLVSSLGRGEDCSDVWEEGSRVADQMGHSEHLMGIPPDQAKFLGHSVGLELDETPVIARGFDRPLEIGGTMAIEPKVIYPDGAIGTEDTWVRGRDGMKCLTMGKSFPMLTEW
ncbi:MAG: M24 family metallopeptidase [Candidatus Thermoplasmatota archaeon]|nr:M24 family metallopeptidase [Candidatus Thermoplasmatota archaeon]MEE3270346.1 M24 family metallopeptidase [Candidatus Thermoplasmatota archaeon]